MKSIGRQITEAKKKYDNIQYQTYVCLNPYHNPECRGKTEALIGSDREINKYCPECQDLEDKKTGDKDLISLQEYIRKTMGKRI